jgi:hypothetical protein
VIKWANYLLAKEFLAYIRDVMQLNPLSVERYWSYLKHLLVWADEMPLPEVAERRPTFAAYLTAPGQRENPSPLAPMTTCLVADDVPPPLSKITRGVVGGPATAKDQ